MKIIETKEFQVKLNAKDGSHQFTFQSAKKPKNQPQLEKDYRMLVSTCADTFMAAAMKLVESGDTSSLTFSNLSNYVGFNFGGDPYNSALIDGLFKVESDILKLKFAEVIDFPVGGNNYGKEEGGNSSKAKIIQMSDYT